MSTVEQQAIGHCGECGTAIPSSHPYAWCTKCGASLPAEIKAKLAAPRRQDPPEMQARQDGTTLVVEGNAVACPICRHDRFRMKNTLMESRGMAILDVEWAAPSAETYICTRCGHVLWFMR
jgi:DNA-directed RNA polymerase subunit RPC12/RpoP